MVDEVRKGPANMLSCREQLLVQSSLLGWKAEQILSLSKLLDAARALENSLQISRITL